ncbi:MAG: serine/threonine-protein kinase [Candidatus Sulfotelmatobacter sp.]|jgi:serine/threonine protein kinase
MNSAVYRAFDPYLQRELAVKEIDKSRLGNDFDSYCQEARAMFAMRDPNVVGIVYVCETLDHVSLALPYFAKGSLQSRIKDGPLETMQLLKMAQDVLSAAARIHANRFLHLDFKPSNIFFDDSNRALVGDFGQSRSLNKGAVSFPAMYKWAMPPEVWDSHYATVESDIYQLGVLFYRAANGEPPYKRQKDAIASDGELLNLIRKGKFPNPKFFLPHVPKRIKSIIRKCIRPQASERYHSASELAIAFARVCPSLSWTTSPLGGGAYRWYSVRSECADLEVNLLQESPSEWKTEVWTSNDGERRRRGISDYWAKHLSYQAACDHLTEVFVSLGQ